MSTLMVLNRLYLKKMEKIINENEVKNIANSLTPTFDVEAAGQQLTALKQGQTIELNGVQYTAESDFGAQIDGKVVLKDAQGNTFTATLKDKEPIMLSSLDYSKYIRIYPNYTITGHQSDENDAFYELVKYNNGTTINLSNRTDTDPWNITITYPNGTTSTETREKYPNISELLNPPA